MKLPLGKLKDMNINNAEVNSLAFSMTERTEHRLLRNKDDKNDLQAVNHPE